MSAVISETGLMSLQISVPLGFLLIVGSFFSGRMWLERICRWIFRFHFFLVRVGSVYPIFFNFYEVICFSVV